MQLSVQIAIRARGRMAAGEARPTHPHGRRMAAEKARAVGPREYTAGYHGTIPTHEQLFAVGKNGPNATFNLFFLMLSWPWVGELVGSITIFT